MAFFENPKSDKSSITTSSKKDINWLVVWNIHGNNMVYGTLVYDYINIYLVGGEWNHGILYDFPFGWEWKIIPTDFHSIIFQRGRYTTNQSKMFHGFNLND